MHDEHVIQVVCPHCAAINRVPTARIEQRPSCGRCHAALFTAQPLELDARNFDSHVGRGDVPVVVDFWAPWCGPCRAMAPTFAAAAARVEPGVRLAKVNTEQAPELAARFGIRSIPTLIAFAQGRELSRQSGAMAMPQLLAWMHHALHGGAGDQ